MRNEFIWFLFLLYIQGLDFDRCLTLNRSYFDYRLSLFLHMFSHVSFSDAPVEGTLHTCTLNKDKVRPKIVYEGPEVEQLYSCILSLTLAPFGDGWSTPRLGRFTPVKGTGYPFYRRLEAPGSVLIYAENLAPTGIRSPDRPAHSESIYRLSYSGRRICTIFYI
jgi:hypothetical protein